MGVMGKFNLLVNIITGMAIGASIFCISLDHRANAAVYVPRETLVAEYITDEYIEDEPQVDAGHWVPMGTYKITYYCNCRRCCGRWAGGPTASETMPEQGRTVACGSLPLGTRVLIEGLGERVVEDRGVSGAHIDVFMNSHSECLRNGVNYKEVYKWVKD